MTLNSRLFDEDPTTYDPNVPGGPIPGEVIARRAGGAGSRVGICRGIAGGLDLIDLIVADVSVDVLVTRPGAFTQLVAVDVKDAHGDPIVGALVNFAVATNLALLSAATTGVGKLTSVVLDALAGHDLLAQGETGVGGTVEIQIATAGAGAGEVYVSGVWPGPGKASASLTFS